MIAQSASYAERIVELSAGGGFQDLTLPRQLKMTVDDLVLLDRSWCDDDRKSTELIDGVIYHTPARFIARAKAVADLMMALRDALGDDKSLTILTHGSTEFSPYDLPLPDLLLTSEPSGERFVPGNSVPLVIEIAESAREWFSGEKLRMYARCGLPEYWVVDLEAGMVMRHARPIATGYEQSAEIAFGQTVIAATLGGMSVGTAALLK